MKNLLNLGKALNKTEQQSINGGGGDAPCHFSATHDCGEGPSSEYCSRNPHHPAC